LDVEPDTALGAFFKEQKEAKYRSTVREPLGQGYKRGHVLPAKTQEPGFMFGKKTSSSKRSCILLFALCCRLF
jgi:hypothetical protein